MLACSSKQENQYLRTSEEQRKFIGVDDETEKTKSVGKSFKKEIEDITCPRVDMNFIFEWSTRYLTSERSSLVRYRVDHEKIKFISISGHVMFCLLYKHQ